MTTSYLIDQVITGNALPDLPCKRQVLTDGTLWASALSLEGPYIHQDQGVSMEGMQTPCTMLQEQRKINHETLGYFMIIALRQVDFATRGHIVNIRMSIGSESTSRP